MPTGVYKRTEQHRKQIREWAAKGHSKEAREKANASLREKAQDKEWRRKVSVATREAMKRPIVREKHLRALKQNMEKYGPGFKGGNGQPMTEIVQRFSSILIPEGFVREYPILTKGHGTGLSAAPAYKADFAHPKKKVVIELDGPSHKSLSARMTDEKKDMVLEALGWTVIRIQHQ